jgi:flagellar biosynthesis protein FlhF
MFRGRTLEEAERAARRTLGADAVVLTTRKVQRAGLLGALQAPEIEIAATAAPKATEPPPRDSRRAGPFAAGVYERDVPRADPLGALRTELRTEMRQLRASMPRSAPPSLPPGIEGDLAALRAAIDRLPAPRATSKTASSAARFVERAGIEGLAASRLSRTVRGNAGGEARIRERLRDSLADICKVTPWPLTGNGRAMIALVGPTGVGKTTTLAKLAARAVLDQGRSATFIACDSFRVGAVEQLSRYGALLGVRVKVATSADELARMLSAVTTDLVFVDTAGRGPIETDDIERCLGEPRIAQGVARHVLFCLPAAVRSADAERFSRIFAPCAPTSLVMTKLDEAATMGGIVHASVASRLPISSLCFGQRVPEDIAPATAGAILDHVFPVVESKKGATAA